MARLIRLLVVEDNRNDAELIVRELRSAGFEPAWQRVETEEEFLAHLQTEIDVVLSDFRMQQFDALRALELLKKSKPEIPFIIVSGTVGDELAATAMKEGAADYLLKDRLARLGLAVSQALEQSRLRKEQKRAEEALRESEARFRELAENIQEIFWLTDPEKDQVLYISPAYETIWGRPRSEVYATPRSWVEGVHPDDRYRVLRAAVTQQVTGTYDEEYRVVHPDGSVRWIHDRAFPVRNAAGEVLRIVGIADNITDRKRAEDAMRASNERFGSFMDNLPGLAWIKDTAGRYVYANKPFREQLVAGRDWYRKTDGELWRPEPAATYQANDRKVIETRAPLQTTEKITHARGERIGLTSKFPILDASGNVAFICGICIDITERQQAEERLSKSEARLAKAEQLAHLGSWDWDVSTDLVSWSEEMFRLVGHSPRKEPVDFQFSLACVHPEDRARYSELTARAIQHGQPYVCECRVVRPDGTVRMLYNQGTVVRDEQGRATRMFGTA
ncbi:MAG: PAS domain-containing protein, partial [Verrucomicrobia bacterium]|nr:PAS domain-containing protein [Verrucomicrobiota bacterium]